MTEHFRECAATINERHEPGNAIAILNKGRSADAPHHIVSLLYVMESSASAETSVVGNEGVVGIVLLMSGESTSSRAVVHSAGAAYRLPGQRIKDEFTRHGDGFTSIRRDRQKLPGFPAPELGYRPTRQRLCVLLNIRGR